MLSLDCSDGGTNSESGAAGGDWPMKAKLAEMNENDVALIARENRAKQEDKSLHNFPGRIS